jgi:hypothetical protein
VKLGRRPAWLGWSAGLIEESLKHQLQLGQQCFVLAPLKRSPQLQVKPDQEKTVCWLAGKISLDCEFISNFSKRPANRRKENTKNTLRFGIQAMDAPFPGGKTGRVPCHTEHVPNTRPDELCKITAEEDMVNVLR